LFTASPNTRKKLLRQWYLLEKNGTKFAVLLGGEEHDCQIAENFPKRLKYSGKKLICCKKLEQNFLQKKTEK
jgi:hypothetical protein